MVWHVLAGDMRAFVSCPLNLFPPTWDLLLEGIAGPYPIRHRRAKYVQNTDKKGMDSVCRC